MPRDLEPDRSLAASARRGDSSAWQALYESTCDRLFAFLCYQIGDRDEARDILQETYLRAFRRLDTWRGDAPLEVWLRAIALGCSRDWKRVVLRRLKRMALLTESSATVEPDTRHVRFDTEREVLDHALRTLSSHQRAALLLREWDDLSFREIAQLLGCRENTARVHHARARERMRQALGEEMNPALPREWEGQQI